jgi:8-oxo-dGTP pyrophosphatase MutT (NUDIX family)
LRTATSAGAIILREVDGELRIGLAHHDRPEKTWVLPKGHVEAGETIEQAALREIYEETGLTQVQLLTHLGSLMRESIRKNGEIEQKTIHYYLAYALEDGQQTPRQKLHSPTSAGSPPPKPSRCFPTRESRHSCGRSWRCYLHRYETAERKPCHQIRV